MPTILNNSLKKALTTLARAKSFLGIGSDSHDARLTVIVNQVTGFIERYTKRSLMSQTYTGEKYDGNGAACLVLKQFPVTSLSSFQYRNSNDPDDDSWTTIDTSDYAWFEDGRVKLLTGPTVEIPQKYRFTYVAGFKIDFDNENSPSLHTLPEEIEYVCHKLTSALFNTRRAEGFEETSVGDMSVRLKKEIFNDAETRAILDKYAAPTI